MEKNLNDQEEKKISISEIDMIRDKIEAKRTGVQIEDEKDSIRVKSGSKLFEVYKDGRVKGSMPLHSFETAKAEELEIRDDEIEVGFIGGTYVFKI